MAPRRNRPRILLVDDSAFMRALLREQVQQALDAEVLTASSGEEALPHALTGELDCVVCDVNMPGMDGVAFVKAVREHLGRLELPILLVTAADSKEDRVRGLRAGASDFLSKPVEPEELAARVETNVELARLHREVTRMAYTDALTGLVNRRRFLTRLDEQSGNAYGVLMLDIDHFKSINDSCGHAVGDAVLAGVAGVLQDCVPPHHLVGRLGGEEFAVLLPGLDLPAASDVAERMRAGVSGNALGGMPRGKVTVSVGVAVALQGETPARVLQRADDLLYRAKSLGRNQVCA
ncbi:MAG: diguanylate cyclase [Myxococcota bacterium]